MHRVELKVKKEQMQHIQSKVPNAPCGVERQVFRQLIDYAKGFLMHRVELKDLLNHDLTTF